ncbi:MAG: response regulator transcription factor [Anaerolineae bacterium]|nr:response regulator transcription factor [Anaerolineae bacterium]
MSLEVLVVDDHEVVRLGLRTLIEDHADFSVVAEAATVRDAVRKALLLHPDVVVMDIRLLGGSGIDACEQITERLPNTRVIMLTSYAEDEMLFDAIAAGACGYVLKQIGNEDLIRALETVARGEALLDPALTQRVFDRMREVARKEHGEAFSELTDQEMRVLAQVAEGKTNREVAEVLYLGEGTVRNYVSSILSKLDLSNRTEAAAYAVKHDLKEFL